MGTNKFWIAFFLSALLVLATARVNAIEVGYVWNDISPNAYLIPPENPPLDSVYMFPPGSPVEGWAVGDAAPTTNVTTSLPSIFHFDGQTWNLVQAPRFPDFPQERFHQ